MKRVAPNSCGYAGYTCNGIGLTATNPGMFKPTVCSATDFDLLNTFTIDNPNNFYDVPNVLQGVVTTAQVQDLSQKTYPTVWKCPTGLNPMQGCLQNIFDWLKDVDSIATPQCYSQVQKYTVGLLQPSFSVGSFNAMASTVTPITGLSPLTNAVCAANTGINTLKSVNTYDPGDCGCLITANQAGTQITTCGVNLYIQGDTHVVCPGITIRPPFNGSYLLRIYANASYTATGWTGQQDYKLVSSGGTQGNGSVGDSLAHRSLMLGTVTRSCSDNKIQVGLRLGNVYTNSLPNSKQFNGCFVKINNVVCSGTDDVGKPTGLPQRPLYTSILVTQQSDADHKAQWSSPHDADATAKGCVFGIDDATGDGRWVNASSTGSLLYFGSGNQLQWFGPPASANYVLTWNGSGLQWLPYGSCDQ